MFIIRENAILVSILTQYKGEGIDLTRVKQNAKSCSYGFRGKSKGLEAESKGLEATLLPYILSKAWKRVLPFRDGCLSLLLMSLADEALFL